MLTLDAEATKLPNAMPWERALKERATIPAEAAVYAIVTNRSIGRLVGESHVLYVGHTGRLGGKSDVSRLYAYRYPAPGSMERRIRNICNELLASGHDLTLRWRLADSAHEAKTAETKLLHIALTNHYELPPLNSAIPRAKP